MRTRRCAPHQDGAAFIVSALVVERRNVAGGISKVYYDARRSLAIAPRQLDPGEGLFQADRHLDLWHEVTPIFPVDPSMEAYRSIIGLDINLVDG